MITNYRGIKEDCETTGTIEISGVPVTTIGQCEAYVDDKLIVVPWVYVVTKIDEELGPPDRQEGEFPMPPDTGR